MNITSAQLAWVDAFAGSFNRQVKTSDTGSLKKKILQCVEESAAFVILRFAHLSKVKAVITS